MSTVDILTIAGMVIYLLGGLVITLPGIVIFEKYHPPGRLLRGIETLEAEPITKDETGFEELREAINDIVKGEYQIGNDIYELDYYSGEVGLGGRMVEYKIVKREKNSNKNIRIEEPAFEKNKISNISKSSVRKNENQNRWNRSYTGRIYSSNLLKLL